MEHNELSPFGDLPPNHPMVLEALKGIIAGPISELRTKVDGLITNPSSTLKKGEIDYNSILPFNTQQKRNVDPSSQITNQLLDHIAPVHYQGNIPVNQPVVVNQTFINSESRSVPEFDPNQMELPLFKQTTIDDIQKKLFDIDTKLDNILKYVKNSQNKK